MGSGNFQVEMMLLYGTLIQSRNNIHTFQRAFRSAVNGEPWAWSSQKASLEPNTRISIYMRIYFIIIFAINYLNISTPLDTSRKWQSQQHYITPGTHTYFSLSISIRPFHSWFILAHEILCTFAWLYWHTSCILSWFVQWDTNIWCTPHWNRLCRVHERAHDEIVLILWNSRII